MKEARHASRVPYTAQSDNELISYVAEGDREAFDELVGRYKNRITNYVYSIVRDREAAVDVAQETFIRVFYKAHTFRGMVQFSTWLYRIATNLAINETRRRKRHPTHSLDEPGGGEEGEVRWDFPDEGPTPDACYELKEVQRLVHHALDQISPVYKIPLVLKEIEGYRYEEIAEILDIPEGTVKSRINRARHALKKHLTT
ncbi:MAG: sigma-70 family RNA polymerase sigma factor, partial [Deltaproteobacteria bacterium]